jgi:hypothetical protein
MTKQSQVVTLQAASKLAEEAQAKLKQQALEALQTSDEFFLMCLKDGGVANLGVTTDPKWIMQGFREFLIQALVIMVKSQTEDNYHNLKENHNDRCKHS